MNDEDATLVGFIVSCLVVGYATLSWHFPGLLSTLSEIGSLLIDLFIGFMEWLIIGVLPVLLAFIAVWAAISWSLSEGTKRFRDRWGEW